VHQRPPHQKHYTFPMQTCKNCAPHISNAELQQSHNTLPIQKSKNCGHHLFPIQMSTTSNDYTFAMQTCQNCDHVQMSTISITTHFLYKQAKIASTHDNHHTGVVSTVDHYTFPIQTSQNCVHHTFPTLVWCPLWITTHFLYNHHTPHISHSGVVSTISITTHFLFNHHTPH
jgi:hypothetical protein